MTNSIKSLLRGFLARTPLRFLPVRVRRGVAAGARWTLFPYSAYWRGTHEPELQRELMALGGGDITGWSCWDLGAHYGLYSIGLARRVGPTGQVAAFEPDTVSFAHLERHRRMNSLDWLITFEAAVSDRTGTAAIYTYGTPGATTSHLPYEDETSGSNVGAIPVQTLQLDELVAAGKVRPPHFVKIDVEGHGHHAVAGMAKTLARTRPILIVAFHSAAEISGVLATLLPLGYTWDCIPRSARHSGEIQVAQDILFSPPKGKG